MIDYSEYNTGDPFRIVNRDLLFESKGIPNVLKSISNDILSDIVNSKDNLKKSYDFNFTEFNTSLYVSIIHYNKSEIYATSEFGIYSNGKLKSSIKIYLNRNKYEQSDLLRVITHELLHIYEIFNRIKNETKKDLQWRLSSYLQKIRTKYKSKFLEDFIYLIYLSLNHEINARVDEAYSILIEKRIDNKSLLLDEVKKTSAYKYSENLISFNINQYNIDYQETLNFFIEINTLMTSKFPKLNFNLYKIPKDEKDCKSLIKEWIFLFRKKGKHFQNKLQKIIDEVINDVHMIESAYIDTCESNELSSKYILRYDIFLERQSKLFKTLRR